MLLTKKQRTALKAVFNRQLLYVRDDGTISTTAYGPLATYRDFRRTVRHGSGCIMVPWCNMWLGIEPDGYTHS